MVRISISYGNFNFNKSFLYFYLNFSFSQYAISVRVANKIPIEDCRRVRSFKNDPHQWKYLCIEGKRRNILNKIKGNLFILII